MTRPADSDPPLSRLAEDDLPLLVRGYIRYADAGGREVLEAVERAFGEQFAAFLLPPVAGGDVFGDIASIASKVVQLVNAIAGHIGDALWSVINRSAQFVGDFWNRLTQVANNVWDSVHWLSDTLYKAGLTIADRVWEAGAGVAGKVWDGLLWAANRVYDGVIGVANNVWQIIDWAANRVYDGVSFVATQVWNGVTWAGNRVWDGISWLGGQVWNVITWAANRVYEGAAWIAAQLWNVITWAGSTVSNGIVYLAGQVWNGFNFVVQHAWDFASNAVRYVVDHAFDPIAGFIAQKLAIPRRYLTGQFQTLDAFLDAFEDPPRPGGIEGFFLSLLGMVAIVASGVFTWGPIAGARITESMMLQFEPTIPSQVQLRDAFLRGELPEGAHDDALGRLGFSDARIAMIKQLYNLEPTPSDLIRMLVREVFSPEDRARLGLDAEFPAAAEARGRRIGFSGQTLRDYWAAHWDLPSPSQGYEMLHRGQIEMAELEGLLKALDYAPVWRQPLISIAYNVPGRIDLRRMYAAGTIDKPRLLKGYTDLGYNPEDAQVLTDFAVKLAEGQPRTLPRELILRAYRDGHLPRGDAAAELEEMGFEPADVEFMLALEDLANAEADAALAEDIIEADFKAGLITEQAARAELLSLGVPETRVSLLIRRWARRNAVRTASLSVSQVQRAYREELLDAGAATGRLRALGFNDVDVGLLLELATPDPAEVEPPELTIAQLRQAFREELITEVELRGRLTRRGFAPEDVELLVEMAIPDPAAAEPAELTKADLRAALTKGILTAAQVLDRLIGKGYTRPDAELLLATWAGRPA